MKIKNLGVGFRFKPSDQDLILTYLFPLAIRATVNPNHPPPPYDGIMECDLYSPDEPWKIHFKNEVNESEFYFFTKQKKKKNEKGKRVDRSFGNCVWKSQKEEGLVYKDGDMNETTIGFKRSFSYKFIKRDHPATSSSSEEGDWVMYEFRLAKVLTDKYCGGIEDYVICCVKKKEADRKAR
ncbi:NAC domain-containing protein 68 [Linum grandiflorum]